MSGVAQVSAITTLDGQLRALGASRPDALAITDGERSATWADLDRAADRVAAVVAATLRSSAAPAGSIVAIDGAGESGPAAIVGAIAGVLRAGLVAAPLPAGPTAAERARILEVLGPTLVLDRRTLGAADLDGVAEPGARPIDGPARDPEAPAIIVMTSGTTGRPKGVVLSHRAMAASAAAWLAVLPPATGWLLAVGLGHVAGLGIVWRAFDRGLPIRVVPPGDTGAILRALGEPPVSHVSLVPTQLDRLLEAHGDAPPPAGLQAVLLGGGPIPGGLVTRAVAAGWPVIPTYGLSEAGSGVTALPSAEAAVAPGSAGRPLPGVELRIDDPDPDGIGEIVVRTTARCSGYLGEASADQGTPLRTGDLGRVDADGRLEVVDRRSDRIVRGGENVDPSEIEAVLLTHPLVADAAVVGLPDPRWGHVPVAVVVARHADEPPDREGLIEHCRASLAGYKVPVDVRSLEALPRTAGGKLRRDAVRALVAGAPIGELARSDGASIGWRITADPPWTGRAGDDRRLHLVLLHASLSAAAQLDRLAAALAGSGDVVVHAIDRRGAGGAGMAPGDRGRVLDVSVQVADLLAYLDARRLDRVVLVGASYGAVVALETAARHPDRVSALVAWEPPYGPLADQATRVLFDRLAGAIAEAHAERGAAAAAETFLRAVAGDAAWERLGPRSRTAIGLAGDAAVTESALLGLRPDDLGRIAAPTTILTGSASESFYAPIADALAERIPGATRRSLPDLGHQAAITDPGPVAAAVRKALLTAGLLHGVQRIPSDSSIPEPIR